MPKLPNWFIEDFEEPEPESETEVELNEPPCKHVWVQDCGFWFCELCGEDCEK